ncbi:tRNA 2-thiouridine(34) synthase MnmA [Sulfurihydrogenibium sp.]|uniref:tRNA 2-thiouridine(34) synthase MnmA n=1 Tax=Sulfurihydrogenibium sp. TaxID=2053621 RepID=UPI00261F7F23|nr:tRNA 2-thiouridine(34) synthase MnmA [Sulfurihydrogenibium sp.]
MKKVVVGLSGGVDSSTAAFLLKEQGYEVVGITLKLSELDECSLDKQVCCSTKDILDAKKVASFLGIQHYVIDWQDIFKDKVIDYFIKGYQSGLTPNPCSICNKDVKTGLLAKYAKKVLKADFLATGHYIKTDILDGLKVIKRGKDIQKDQSYFLALVEREVIDMLIFPLGEYIKEEVRKIAEKSKIPVSQKLESFEICFTAGKTPQEYFKSLNIPLKEGYIVHVSGKVLGKHKGLESYTIGQRKGLNVSWKEPLYVLDKNPENNTVIVGEKEYLLTDKVVVTDFNFLVPIEKWEKIMIQGRYKQNPVEVKSFDINEKSITFHFKQKQQKFAPGQILAVYQDDILLGGGIIQKL